MGNDLYRLEIEVSLKLTGGTPVDICSIFDFVFLNSTNCCLFSTYM